MGGRSPAHASRVRFGFLVPCLCVLVSGIGRDERYQRWVARITLALNIPDAAS